MLIISAWRKGPADRTGQVAAECNPAIKMTTPQSRFGFSDDGTTVTDIWSGLVWQRCALGATLDDQGTTSPLDDYPYSWQDALQAADTLNSTGGFAGASDWRVPNIKELITIIEHACFSPAMNELVFPNLLVDGVPWIHGGYWSSPLRKVRQVRAGAGVIWSASPTAA